MYVLQKQVRTKSCFEIFPRRAHSSLPHKLKKISSVAMSELSLTSRALGPNSTQLLLQYQQPKWAQCLAMHVRFF